MTTWPGCNVSVAGPHGDCGPGLLSPRGAVTPVVVKLGGSLFTDPPCLRRWLSMLAEHGAGRVVIVPGGGAFADAVRAAQLQWACDDLTAHNMAVLAMAQNACLLQALAPSLRLGHDIAGLRSASTAGAAAVWVPCDALRSSLDATTDWRTTSDSLALHLAERLGAEQLVLVKSCDVGDHPSTGWDAHHAAGRVDAAFPELAAAATCRPRLVAKGDIGAVRALLTAPRASTIGGRRSPP